jgi:hypothetical protein
MSENDGPWLSIFIFGSSENHKVTNLDNEEPAEAGECNFSPEIHELTMPCVRARREEVRKIQSFAFSIPTRVILFRTRSRTSKIISVIHCDTRWYNFFMNYPARIEKEWREFSWFFYLLMGAFFCLGDCGVCLSSLCLLVFRVVFEKLTSVTRYGPIKKMWFSFEAFKHLCRHFVLTRVLIVVQIFWNHLCTHCSHHQILRSNFVDRTFINIKLIGGHSNCQTSISTNESPHTVDVCACSHRGGASR